MPLISSFLRRLIGMNNQGQAERKAWLGRRQLCEACLEEILGGRYLG